jgi:hypothetical protein
MTLGIIAAVLVVSALVLALAAMRHWRLRYESLESSVVALRREVGLAASISARTGRRVQRVEHDYSGVADRVDLVESRVTPSAIASGSLDQAIDSARCGADAAKLAAQYNLSGGEADLVVRLYGRKSA